MWGQLSFALFVLLAAGAFASEDVQEARRDRDGKLLPIFQVVKFANDLCSSSSTSRNGTCYTR